MFKLLISVYSGTAGKITVFRNCWPRLSLLKLRGPYFTPKTIVGKRHLNKADSTEF